LVGGQINGERVREAVRHQRGGACTTASVHGGAQISFEGAKQSPNR
jgi:hypothetical protein